MTMQKPMTVMFVHGITEIGGAERELLRILDRLSDFKYRALVVCPERGPLHDELSHRKIETRSVPFPAWRKLRSYPRRPAAVRCLRNVIVAERPDLLHVNDIWWVPQTLRASTESAIPILAHVRQKIEPQKVRRYELEKVDRVLPVARQIQRSLEAGGVRPERLSTLHSGIDIGDVPDDQDGSEIRRRFGIPGSAPLLGTVANLFPRKGYDVMLRALPAILNAVPDIHYLIVGGGDASYEKSLRSLVGNLGLDHRVHFAGFQESIYPYLAAMDLYVQPAHMEGLPIAVLEAMAMRKPVVATFVGGLPEVVEDGQTGYLVGPGDPGALAQASLKLLSEPGRGKDMGIQGRTRVEKSFTIETMMRELINGYNDLLMRTPHGSSLASE